VTESSKKGSGKSNSFCFSFLFFGLGNYEEFKEKDFRASPRNFLESVLFFHAAKMFLGLAFLFASSDLFILMPFKGFFFETARTLYLLVFNLFEQYLQ